ncbi:DUF3472 domain-containing protein [Pedobacter immunditicola]|uniref:DUF3472 domain-containing protein n=1 Tax=Pedobacter immunditicola TaxID=3133440 RepID=UPI0030AFBD34
MKKILFSLTLLSCVLLISFKPGLPAENKSVVSIALGGNAWVNKKDPRAVEEIKTAGLRNWKSPGSVISIYFKVENVGKVDLALRMKVTAGKSRFKVSYGKQSFTKHASNSIYDTLAIGTFQIIKKGYVKIDIQGLDKTGADFGEISHLIVKGDEVTHGIHFVQDNEQSRFYWGRRGPSVHLNYIVPEEIKEDIEWFYSEINVPKGMDPIGSYFQANGFGQGYFGIQVNSPTERRVLFSLWSPFVTDDPGAIPDSLKIKLLKKGKDVYTGEFGNEGSGGQSYLVYPWKVGETYAFLTRAQPDPAQNTTTYTSYFKPSGKEWMLIASFIRPTTQTRLKGLYAFVENFDPEMGNLERKANFGNQWLRDVKGNWTEVLTARFTGDDIAKREFRKDIGGGVEGGLFYLRNGGFFSDDTPLKKMLNRPSTNRKAPAIDFSKLQ